MSEATDAARQAITDLRTIIEHDITHQPRTLQTALGPSDIANACDRCLIHALAGTATTEHGRAPWLPYTGNAVHDILEMALVKHEISRASNGHQHVEWFAEGGITVGELRGQPVKGHSDVFHVPTGTVVDYKYVGETTRKKVRADGSGTSQTYRGQAQLYGRGWALAGYNVRAVAVWFLPRNGLTLTVDRLFVTEYDEAEAVAVLERANRFASWVDMFGAEQVLASAPPHTGQEFSCNRYPDAPSNVPATVAGLIPTAS